MLLLLGLACAPPLDGALAPGVWGGPHWSLDVAEDGSAVLQGDCAHATLEGPLVAVDGRLRVEFTLVPEGGPTPDTGWGPGNPATLDAQATARRLDGTLTVLDQASDFTVELGAASELYRCL